ncbi:hypothetical protein GOBAR_AA24222 [Gossypium barbadense]|uniref:Uncharacterized protein n=4 Tax=rosids TaxID=71275 RepID=A0A2P5WZD8_GOSBA|nr:hypothetical protein GOBAR_AA24222 [Gossypium barbadense]
MADTTGRIPLWIIGTVTGIPVIGLIAGGWKNKKASRLYEFPRHPRSEQGASAVGVLACCEDTLLRCSSFVFVADWSARPEKDRGLLGDEKDEPGYRLTSRKKKIGHQLRPQSDVGSCIGETISCLDLYEKSAMYRGGRASGGRGSWSVRPAARRQGGGWSGAGVEANAGAANMRRR